MANLAPFISVRLVAFCNLISIFSFLITIVLVVALTNIIIVAYFSEKYKQLFEQFYHQGKPPAALMVFLPIVAFDATEHL